MKNRERLKGFITGIIVATIITSAGFAASNGKMIEVFYGTIKDIKINQVSKMSTGDLAPFVYKGSTFVPLRYISDNLGLPVKWDNQTKVIHIGEMPGENETYIGDGIDYMNYQEGMDWNYFAYNYNSEKPMKDNIGNEYSNYCILRVGTRSWNYLEFPTNGQYKRFKANLALTDEYKNTKGTLKFEIFADDKLVYEKTMQAGEMPENIDVAINSAIKVKFKLSNPESGGVELGLFNPRFIK